MSTSTSTQSTRKKADDVASGAAKLKEDLARLVGEASAFLTESTAQTARAGAEKTRATYDQSVSGMREGYSTAMDTASELAEVAENEIRKRPFTTVGLTLGAGLIIGSLLTLGGRKR